MEVKRLGKKRQRIKNSLKKNLKKGGILRKEKWVDKKNKKIEIQKI